MDACIYRDKLSVSLCRFRAPLHAVRVTARAVAVVHWGAADLGAVAEHLGGLCAGDDAHVLAGCAA